MAVATACFVTGRLLSCRDAFTGTTRVKQNRVLADPRVSNLTTGVVRTPLVDGGCSGAPPGGRAGLLLGDHPERRRYSLDPQRVGAAEVVPVELPAERPAGPHGGGRQAAPAVHTPAQRRCLAAQ